MLKKVFEDDLRHQQSECSAVSTKPSSQLRVRNIPVNGEDVEVNTKQIIYLNCGITI